MDIAARGNKCCEEVVTVNDTATVMADRLLLLGGLERNKVVANRNELKRFLRAYFGAPKQ